MNSELRNQTDPLPTARLWAIFHVDNIALPFIVDRKKLNLISERCVRRESGILFSLIVGEVRTDSHRPDLTDCHARDGVSDRGVSETLANS